MSGNLTRLPAAPASGISSEGGSFLAPSNPGAVIDSTAVGLVGTGLLEGMGTAPACGCAEGTGSGPVASAEDNADACCARSAPGDGAAKSGFCLASLCALSAANDDAEDMANCS